jgi:hypothetical protein
MLGIVEICAPFAIRPGQSNPAGLPGWAPRRFEQVGSNRVLFRCELAYRHSMRVSPIILNGTMSQCSAILAFRTTELMSNLFSRVLIAKSDPQNTASLG